MFVDGCAIKKKEKDDVQHFVFLVWQMKIQDYEIHI